MTRRAGQTSTPYGWLTPFVVAMMVTAALILGALAVVAVYNEYQQARYWQEHRNPQCVTTVAGDAQVVTCR
jgi:hypothetical protein